MKTEAQKRASIKYRQQKETVSLELPKGTREKWKARAEAVGMSMTAYIVSLVESDIEKSDSKE